MPTFIIVTWYLGDKYHLLYLRIPINVLYLLNIEDITVLGGVTCSFPYQEVVLQADVALFPQYDHWVGLYDLLNIFRHNSDL